MQKNLTSQNLYGLERRGWIKLPGSLTAQQNGQKGQKGRLLGHNHVDGIPRHFLDLRLIQGYPESDGDNESQEGQQEILQRSQRDQRLPRWLGD